MEVTNRNSRNVRLIRDFMSGNFLLPETKALIYPTTTATEEALSSLSPSTPKEIFDTWARISNNAYYPTVNDIPPASEAAAWVWDETQQSALMPLNSATHLGFISDESIDYYNHEVTLQSADADDDYNGVIFAFRRDLDTMTNRYFGVRLCNDMTNTAAVPAKPNIHFFYRENMTDVILKTIDIDSISGGWRNKFKRISVQRRGNIFNVRFSLWNQTTYEPSMDTTIDLDDYPQTKQFKGPQHYGYYNMSQARSVFKDIIYYGGYLRNIIIDVQANQVFRYRENVGWQILEDVLPSSVFGTPRILVGPDGSRYRLNRDDAITIL